MKVVDLLEQRRRHWQQLETLCTSLEQRRRKVTALGRLRFAALYRAACADLALADAYQLPPGTVRYLHHLVARAHNQLYRSRSFHVSSWWREMTVNVPGRLFRDGSLWLAFALFWGTFLACVYLAHVSPGFAEDVVGAEMLEMMDTMHGDSVGGRNADVGVAMTGYYVMHNAGIGLQCFAAGLLFGVGGLFITISNAAILGTVFGHMISSPARDNFFVFVTAHGPFELTAIVLSAAAGMRLGFSLIDTRGRSRWDSLRNAGREAVPAISAAIILFCLAAIIEAFISPSALPYAVKASVAVASALALVFYFVVLGYLAGGARAT